MHQPVRNRPGHAQPGGRDPQFRLTQAQVAADGRPPRQRARHGHGAIDPRAVETRILEDQPRQLKAQIGVIAGVQRHRTGQAQRPAVLLVRRQVDLRLAALQPRGALDVVQDQRHPRIDQPPAGYRHRPGDGGRRQRPVQRQIEPGIARQGARRDERVGQPQRRVAGHVQVRPVEGLGHLAGDAGGDPLRTGQRHVQRHVAARLPGAALCGERAVQPRRELAQIGQPRVEGQVARPAQDLAVRRGVQPRRIEPQPLDPDRRLRPVARQGRRQGGLAARQDAVRLGDARAQPVRLHVRRQIEGRAVHGRASGSVHRYRTGQRPVGKSAEPRQVGRPHRGFAVEARGRLQVRHLPQHLDRGTRAAAVERHLPRAAGLFGKERNLAPPRHFRDHGGKVGHHDLRLHRPVAGAVAHVAVHADLRVGQGQARHQQPATVLRRLDVQVRDAGQKAVQLGLAQGQVGGLAGDPGFRPAQVGAQPPVHGQVERPAQIAVRDGRKDRQIGGLHIGRSRHQRRLRVQFRHRRVGRDLCASAVAVQIDGPALRRLLRVQHDLGRAAHRVHDPRQLRQRDPRLDVALAGGDQRLSGGRDLRVRDPQPRHPDLRTLPRHLCLYVGRAGQQAIHLLLGDPHIGHRPRKRRGRIAQVQPRLTVGRQIHRPAQVAPGKDGEVRQIRRRDLQVEPRQRAFGIQLRDRGVADDPRVGARGVQIDGPHVLRPGGAEGQRRRTLQVGVDPAQIVDPHIRLRRPPVRGQIRRRGHIQRVAGQRQFAHRQAAFVPRGVHRQRRCARQQRIDLRDAHAQLLPAALQRHVESPRQRLRGQVQIGGRAAGQRLPRKRGEHRQILCIQPRGQRKRHVVAVGIDLPVPLQAEPGASQPQQVHDNGIAGPVAQFDPPVDAVAQRRAQPAVVQRQALHPEVEPGRDRQRVAAAGDGAAAVERDPAGGHARPVQTLDRHTPGPVLALARVEGHVQIDAVHPDLAADGQQHRPVRAGDLAGHVDEVGHAVGPDRHLPLQLQRLRRQIQLAQAEAATLQLRPGGAQLHVVSEERAVGR
ncbi:hypothetical protein PARU111607_07865 [Palleronia rufa]